MGRDTLILLTNDDGVWAPGIRALAAGLAALGEVRVVAPLAECSGTGCRITLKDPLRVRPVERGGVPFGLGVEGSPVDCVKLAFRVFLPRSPDLVVSGVNQGANLGVNAFYSGTVGAALEGAMLGVPSLALSLARFTDPDFRLSVEVGTAIARAVLGRGLPGRTLLNVNVPPLDPGEVRGLRLTRQGTGGLREEYERRTDPTGRDYYWIKGQPSPGTKDETSDDAAVRAGYVSVTPMVADLSLRGGPDGLDGLEGLLRGLLPERGEG
ncbi:MAG: 5'/3'-nucleotidase SurE [Planctomycetes bacterium]|nr:5'/3'-nucleotidase SurE [Planctomycetota bacterium]